MVEATRVTDLQIYYTIWFLLFTNTSKFPIYKSSLAQNDEDDDKWGKKGEREMTPPFLNLVLIS